MDTVALVAVGDPASGHFQVELWVYSDEDIGGATTGFVWDNAKVQMDSAKASALTAGAFTLGTFFYEQSNITLTNSNRRFLFGGLAFTSALPGDVSTRRLWATYYFNTTGWTGSDNVTFETQVWGIGTDYSYVEFNTNEEFYPVWMGALTIPPPSLNDPPVLAAIGAKSVNEGALLSFGVSATDPNGDAITLTASPLPTGANFTDNGNGTGTFSWTPNFTQANVYNIKFKAVDSKNASDSEIVAITVNNVNQAPVLNAIGPKSVDEGALLTFPVSASDPDGTIPALSATNLPAGASFTDNGNGTGTFSWTPNFTQAGVFNVTFAASDGVLTDDEIVAITVSNVNQAPVLAAIGPQSTPVEVLLSFGVSATDPDGTIPTLSATNLPTGASFTDNGDGTGTFDWTPAIGQEGVHNVTFTASDGVLTDDEIVAITVTGGANEAPVLNAIGGKTIDENALLQFTVSASDPDGGFPELTAEDLPTGATFVDSLNGVGLFTWTPDFTQAGVYNVRFIASDGLLADSELVEITVNNVNRPPVLITMAEDTTIDECGSASFWFDATDPDGGVLTFSADGLVANMAFDQLDSGALFTFNPDTTQAGSYTVTVRVQDALLATDSVIFTITVEECTTPPPCVDLILSDTVLFIHDTITFADGPYGFRVVTVGSTGPGAGCFIVLDTTAWLSATPPETCTPANVTISYDATGLPAGDYYGIVMFQGDATVCEPRTYYVMVALQLVDTTTVPEGADTLFVGIVPAAPGAEVVVPMEFTNSCDLFSAQATLEWNPAYLTLDSVGFEGSRLDDFPVKAVDIFAGHAVISADFGGSAPMVGPGFGGFANLYLTVAPGAPVGFHEISIVTPTEDTYFGINCGGPDLFIPPVPENGGVAIDTSTAFTCGYVVDTAGDPIAGATVEMWSGFPGMGPEASTTSGADGYFEFTTELVYGQFDLWAYKEGYYPGLIENVNWGETGIMIVLTPYAPVYPTLYWVDFYCDANTYFGSPLPIGSVIDAYDPDGVRCGSWFVKEAGKYGFMPVYGEEEWNEGDQGAEPGDEIRFFINGVEAEATGNTLWANAPTVPQMVCLNLDVCRQVCDLTAGWNLVSWSIDTESDDIEAALASIAPHIQLVLGFEQGGLTYDPTLPQFSTLWYVDHLSGYWIKVDADVEMVIEGNCANVSTPITVTPGWNLVSYLPHVAMPTPDALTSIYDDLMVALGFDGGALIYVPSDSGFNTLDEMAPCFGYWVKVDAPGELIYPSDGPVVFAQQRQPLGHPLPKAAEGVTATTQWMNLYAQKLTVDGAVVPTGARVEAFTLDGHRIGSSQVRADGLFGFMPVYADDPNTSAVDGLRTGEPFTLTVNGAATAETFVFTGHGTNLEVSGLTAKAGEEPTMPGTYALAQNYPNPFNPTTTIEFSLPKETRAKVEVFNVLGELVATPFDGTAAAGTTSVTWDGRSRTGSPVASGVYFYRLSADNYTETKKMMLMK